MKSLLLSALLLVSSVLCAQTKDTTRSLLADETYAISGKNSVKIECYNETIAGKLSKAFDQLFKRVSYTWKTDRYGKYKVYSFYLSKPDFDTVSQWCSKNL